MAEKEPTRFAASPDLVPIRALLPESHSNSGAILVMTDGSFRQVIRSSSINFDMKSPMEQAGITYAFGELVNSLAVDFQIQIVSHSKRLDTDAYLRQFDVRANSDHTPPKIRMLIDAHRYHFETQVKANNLLAREIYVVIPYKSSQGPVERSVTDDIPLAGIFNSFMNSAKKKAMQNFTPSDLEIATARQQLEQRASRVIGRLEDAGLHAHPLNEEELRLLLYELYNPSLAEKQKNPGLDTAGSLLSGFSAESLPQTRRRIGDKRPVEAPTFD